MYNLIISCNLSHIIVPKYCYVGVSLASCDEFDQQFDYVRD